MQSPHRSPQVPKGLCPQLETLCVNDGDLAGIFFQDARLIPRFQWDEYRTPPPLSLHQLNHLKSFFSHILMSAMDTSFTQYLTSLVDLEIQITTGSSNAFAQDASMFPTSTGCYANLINVHCLTAAISTTHSLSPVSIP